MKKIAPVSNPSQTEDYDHLVSGISTLFEQARRASARSVNVIMTTTYWNIGRQIVEYEQQGKKRALYGEALLEKLAVDLTQKFGKGFSRQNLQQMRQFYGAYPTTQIRQTLSGKSLEVSSEISISNLTAAFPLSWSHYVKLLSVKKVSARVFYETEALRCGWSVRQLDRQISSQFYERTALSKNKAAMLIKGSKKQKSDLISAEEEIKDPFVLEFLNLKDEYSESDLEEALIKHLEHFLMELGGDFTFVARQKRLRIGDEWFRVDLVFFHRGLRSLILIDLKLKKFSYADVGQMHMYLNYARKHWTRPDENPPVGLILCAQKDASMAKYALEGLSNKVLASEYWTQLPKEKDLIQEIEQTRRILETRKV